MEMASRRRGEAGDDGHIFISKPVRPERRGFAMLSLPFDFAQGERMLLIRCGRRW